MKRFIVLLLFVFGYSFGNAQGNAIYLDSVLVSTQLNEKYLDSVFAANTEYTSYYILFEFDKHQLRAQGFPYLDTMAVYLIKHDSLIMEVQNHRDANGSDQYGSDITMRRAKVVVDYLISKGVDPSRLVAKGYGDSKPIVSEDQIKYMKTYTDIKVAHSKNRRTVFKIISNG